MASINFSTYSCVCFYLYYTSLFRSYFGNLVVMLCIINLGSSEKDRCNDEEAVGPHLITALATNTSGTLTESGIASASRSNGLDDKLGGVTPSCVASIYSTLSPLGLILPTPRFDRSCVISVERDSFSTSFTERDSLLSRKLNKISHRLQLGLPLSDGDGTSVSGFNVKELEIALSTDDAGN